MENKGSLFFFFFGPYGTLTQTNNTTCINLDPFVCIPYSPLFPFFIFYWLYGLRFCTCVRIQLNLKSHIIRFIYKMRDICIFFQFFLKFDRKFGHKNFNYFKIKSTFLKNTPKKLFI